MKDKKFIFTYDKEVREQLITLGYIEVQTPAHFYMFVNNNKMNFAENDIDMSKVKFTKYYVCLVLFSKGYYIEIFRKEVTTVKCEINATYY